MESRRLSDWLAVLSEDNWEICAQNGILGFPARAHRQMADIAPGDHIWIYISRKYVDRQYPPVQRMRAVVEVTGPTRRLKSVPWHKREDQAFPLIKPIRLLAAFDVEGLALLKQMSIALPGDGWASRLQRAPLRITTDDASRISTAIDRATTRESRG